MIAHIVACSLNHVIGVNGKIPWHIPEDLRHFKKLTLNCPVIMGRKTFESIGKPLPKRYNTIVTRSPDYKQRGCGIANSIPEAIEFYQKLGYHNIFIIGGDEIYRQSLEYIDTIYITKVHTSIPNGDAFYPLIPNDFQEIKRIQYKNECTFLTYVRKPNGN